MKAHLFAAKFFVILIIAFSLHWGSPLLTCMVPLKGDQCIMLACTTLSSHIIICLVADFVPILPYLFQLLGMILSISLCKNIHSEDYTKVPKS